MIEQEKFTKYETARILGARALQLAMDAPVLLKIDKEKLEQINFDVLKIAELELEAGVLPITVKKPFPKKSEDRIKKIEKEAEEKKEEKKPDDKETEELEEKEEHELKEEGEIMELAQPDDELEASEESAESGEEI